MKKNQKHLTDQLRSLRSGRHDWSGGL